MTADNFKGLLRVSDVHFAPLQAAATDFTFDKIHWFDMGAS